MTYNCETKKVELDSYEGSIISFGYSKECCSSPKQIYFIDSKIIQPTLRYNSIVPHYHTECTDPPGSGCNTCPEYVTFNIIVSCNTTFFTSVSGTIKEYSDPGLTNLLSTVPITNMSVFNTDISYQVQSDIYIVWEFTLSNSQGDSCSFKGGISSTEQSCINDTFAYLPVVFTNNVKNYFNSDGLNVELSDGFYMTNLGCLLVECNSFQCKVENKIKSLYSSVCYECNSKKDLDAAMELYMAYQLFVSDCFDCCTKCYLYNKINDLLNDCTNC